MKRRTNIWVMVFGLSVLLMTGFQQVTWAEADRVEAENTKPPLQIINQTGVKVVVQVNYSDTAPNGIGKQIMAVKNLHDHYTALSMKAGKDYEIIMVFRAEGSHFLLTDEAYDLKVKESHAKGNPNKTMIEALYKGGVKMYECYVSMKLKDYKPEDLFPFSRIVVSGIGTMIDLEKAGFLPMTP